jgi:formylglycine-generating enzyme required for sulfatase activity
MKSQVTASAILVAVVLAVGSAQAVDVFNMPAGQTSLQFVTVGNPGNAPDTRYTDQQHNKLSIGAVNYTYDIGQYDITAGQYCAFLDAVAANDYFGLYNANMNYGASSSAEGCNIVRSGSPGNYTYSVAADWANRPVNYVSWGDAARFCNWLQNGQPTGTENNSTTEDGAYFLNRATSDSVLMSVTRKPGATYWIPSADEWYKAAYYDPNKPGGAGYWNYATKSSTAPINTLDAAGTNNTNHFDNQGTGNGTYTLGSPYYRNEVGAFAACPSAYGTFDQSGNIWNWTESITELSDLSGTGRSMRGGSYLEGADADAANSYWTDPPSHVINNIGFRVASQAVPEPGSVALLFAGAAAFFMWRRARILRHG